MRQILVFISESIFNESDRYKNKTKTRSIRYKLRLNCRAFFELTLLVKTEKYVTLVRNSHAATISFKGKKRHE